MLRSAASSENYARLEITVEVFCVFIARVKLTVGLECTMPAVTQTWDLIRPTAGKVLSCEGQKKKPVSMKPYFLGNENVPWRFSQLPTQVVTFCVSASSGIWRLADTKLIQIPSTTARERCNVCTLKSRNLGWRSCSVDHGDTESCDKQRSGTYQWCQAVSCLSPMMLAFAAAFNPFLLGRPEGNVLCCGHIKPVQNLCKLGANSDGSSK